MTAARLTHVPRDWTNTDWLLTDIVHVLTGEQHPGRPNPSAGTAAERAESRTAALADHKRRMAEREARLAAADNP